MNTRFFFVLLIFLNLFFRVEAQQDTLLISAETDTVIISDKITKEHKPVRAVMLSSVLPGAGQAYNKQYWKIPLFYSALGTTAFSFDYFNKKYQLYKDGLIERQIYNTNLGTDSAINLTMFINEDETTLTQYKDKYRRNRDLSALVFLAVYALNIIDATVYAHLANFDVSDDLSLTIQPEVIPLYTTINRNTIGLSICFKF